MPASRAKPLVSRLLTDYCERHDLSLVIDHALGHAGYIANKAGKRSFFVGTRFDLNPLGASEIARDKAYTAEFLRRDGFPVPDSLLISSPTSIATLSSRQPGYTDTLIGFQAAERFAKKAGYPLFAKPNDGKEGSDVFKVRTQAELASSLTNLFQRHDKALLQQAAIGRDIRVLVLGNKILCAVERTAPTVVGDGLSSLADLAGEIKQIALEDPRLVQTLEDQGYALSDVPSSGVEVTLLPTANLSSGGSARDVTPDLPKAISDVAIASGKALGLSYFGADLIVENAQSAPAPDFKILELNAAPGLSMLHRLGPVHAKMVEGIYEQVFDALTQQMEAAY
ncbi:ATP-dependent carboxylate-amine ligase [Roseibium sp.]|uniref:ATP-dependent carboxylate-amine ligase n=1 Tax=Roseibium sp. TaxID=1936156 RepID=UPI003263D201